MRFAIIDSNSLKVINVCQWEGAEWLPPFGTFVVRSDRASVDDIFDPLTNDFIFIDRTSSNPVEEE